jgi:hypothetical protein
MSKKIIVYKNPDKEHLKVDKWVKGRDLLDIPQMRALFISIPNGGKTNLVLNIIREGQYEKVIIIHPDDNSKDYSIVQSAIFLKEIPAQDEWEEITERKKTLVVIDDIEISLLDKQQLINLKRLYGYVSSHYNVHPVLCYQEWYSIPIYLRKISNVIALWKTRSLRTLTGIGSQLGFDKEQFKAIIMMLQKTHDFLLFDLTKDSPAPIRLNGYEVIEEIK